MRWRKMDAYYLESGCQQYTIAKTHGPPGTRYSAWRRTTGAPDVLLGTFEDAATAKARCREHAESAHE